MPSQPCGWTSCAPQWSQAERTDRWSSGSPRVKQLFLNNPSGEMKTSSVIYWPSILQTTSPSCLTLNRDLLNSWEELKVYCNCTVSQSSWRGTMTLPLNCSQSKLKVIYNHAISQLSAYWEKMSNCSFVHERRKLKQCSHLISYFQLILCLCGFFLRVLFVIHHVKLSFL